MTGEVAQSSKRVGKRLKRAFFMAIYIKKVAFLRRRYLI
jgi:hypothetical protein